MSASPFGSAALAALAMLFAFASSAPSRPALAIIRPENNQAVGLYARDCGLSCSSAIDMCCRGQSVPLLPSSSPPHSPPLHRHTPRRLATTRFWVPPRTGDRAAVGLSTVPTANMGLFVWILEDRGNGTVIFRSWQAPHQVVQSGRAAGGSAATSAPDSLFNSRSNTTDAVRSFVVVPPRPPSGSL